MARLTAKYTLAIAALLKMNIPKAELLPQDMAYAMLHYNGYFWDVPSQQWIDNNGTPATVIPEPEPERPEMRIRLSCHWSHMKQLQADVIEGLTLLDYTLIDKSGIQASKHDHDYVLVYLKVTKTL